jgi:sugar/nucleoside kinase (ribokinase family)
MGILRVLTIGGATQDIIIEYHPNQDSLSIAKVACNQQTLLCKEGSKIEVEKLHYATGGGATNAAVSFKKLGCNVSAFFKIGADQAGEFIVQKMKEEGVASHYKIVTPTQTGTSFIIPTPNKDRIIFAYRGANGTLKKDDIPQDLIASQNLVYITSLSEQAAHALPYITRMARKSIPTKGIRVAVNPGTSQLTCDVQTLKAALPDIDILILNADEMKMLMGSLKPRFFKSSDHYLFPQAPSLLRENIAHDTLSFTLGDYFKEILSYGVKRIVVTNGKEGVYIATPDKIYFHAALETTVVNTVGAGDAFGSCFTTALALGTPIEDAIRAGVLQAQSVISYQDAKSGLLTFQELEKKLKDLDTSLLQVFDFS